MAWMILLTKEKDVGRGCSTCKFCVDDKCLVDDRVSVYRDGEVDEHRPYRCPFRYWDEKHKPICKKLDGMTEEETTGFFKGADWVARHYTELEKERDRYVEYRLAQENGK